METQLITNESHWFHMTDNLESFQTIMKTQNQLQINPTNLNYSNSLDDFSDQ